MEGSEDIPVLAECFSGPFAIYSTKECVSSRSVVLITESVAAQIPRVAGVHRAYQGSSITYHLRVLTRVYSICLATASE